jgi:aspartyl-tRNA(Asn)/glutamyl-tRNA(Gln) amidotransferase subunit C
VSNTIEIRTQAETPTTLRFRTGVKLEVSIEISFIPNESSPELAEANSALQPESRIGISIAPEVGSSNSRQTQIGSTATVSQWRKVARLARVAIPDDEIVQLCMQLNSILSFVEQLQEVNVEGVEPMTSVTPMAMKKRHDVVAAGGIADDIVKNAPASEDHFFLVPKVVE